MTEKDDKRGMEWPDKDTGPNIDAIIRDLNEGARILGIPYEDCKRCTMFDLVNNPLVALKSSYRREP